MDRKRYVVMGAGEVGFHLARSLSAEGQVVTVVELDRVRQGRVADDLDALVVRGNGADLTVLQSAEVGTCDLFIAVSSSDEANLAASSLAKHLGAARCVVRVKSARGLMAHRKVYEGLFGADLLFSTQLLTTTRILNRIRGHNTMAIEYLAGGKVQLRKIHLDEASPLTGCPLRDVEMPEGSLVVAYFRGDELIIPSGNDKAQPGDDALIMGNEDVINAAELAVSSSRAHLGTVVIAAGGATGFTVAQALDGLGAEVKIIERDSRRAEVLADQFPRFQIIHGDAADDSLLHAERIGKAQTFVALSGHDETNLMACLLAQDLGVPQVIPLVHRAEKAHLWRRMGLEQVFSPRTLAYELIREYIDCGYSANIVSLRRGAAQAVERRIEDASPVAGATLSEVSLPRGLIVGAVVRDETAFVPRGKDKLNVGDLLILFVQKEERDKLQLFFPGHGED
jgi:trk system potassium uptake protein TrkA